MLAQPRISVIIPAYNEASAIKHTLNALADQTVQAFEIIVVDNNSSDDTEAVARLFPKVHVLKEPRQGIAHARNAGFGQASGDIIARLDADTLPASTWVESVAYRFENDNELAALGGPSAPKELSFLGTKTAAWLYGRFRLWHEKSLGLRPMLYGCNMALRASAWQQISNQTTPNDKQIAEDVEVTILLNQAGLNVGYEPRMMIKFAWVRGLNPKKLHSYYQHDNYTLKKHRYGNSKRRA